MTTQLAENLLSTDSPPENLDHADTRVPAELSFAVPQDSKPSFDSSPVTGGEPALHFRTSERLVTISDMRPRASELCLDREGFALRVHASGVRNFYDDREIRATCELEVEDLLERATGAEHVAVFDHTRRSDAPSGATNLDGARGPAGRVHVDYTAASGPVRAADVLGRERFERLIHAGGRVAQMNVWRPIVGPVRRSPLALADARTIDAADLIATDQAFPDRVGEIYHLAWSPHQRWYWAPEMEPHEVLLITGWDSLDDGRARFTPHSAFDLPRNPVAQRPRESIESRAFLVFDH